jgi:hypothetical protein
MVLDNQLHQDLAQLSSLDMYQVAGDLHLAGLTSGQGNCRTSEGAQQNHSKQNRKLHTQQEQRHREYQMCDPESNSTASKQTRQKVKANCQHRVTNLYVHDHRNIGQPTCKRFKMTLQICMII